MIFSLSIDNYNIINIIPKEICFISYILPMKEAIKDIVFIDNREELEKEKPTWTPLSSQEDLINHIEHKFHKKVDHLGFTQRGKNNINKLFVHPVMVKRQGEDQIDPVGFTNDTFGQIVHTQASLMQMMWLSKNPNYEKVVKSNKEEVKEEEVIALD